MKFGTRLSLQVKSHQAASVARVIVRKGGADLSKKRPKAVTKRP